MEEKTIILTGTMRMIDIDTTEMDETITKVEYYYDRLERMWCVSSYNKDGFQIGSTEYCFTEKEAKKVAKWTSEENDGCEIIKGEMVR